MTREDGQVLPLVAITLVMLLAIACLVLDGGSLYAAQRRVQLAADAGALAGADDVEGNGSTVTTDASSYALANAPNSSVAVTASPSTSSDSVQDSKPVPLIFGGLFGLHPYTVSASATAQLQANYASFPTA